MRKTSSSFAVALGMLLLTALLIACSKNNSTSAEQASSSTSPPAVITEGAASPAALGSVQITEFTIPTADSGPAGITTGPDGALWFVEQKVGKIGRVTTAGAFTEYPIPTASSNPTAITAGPDGALWFANSGVVESYVGRVTTSGAFTQFMLPSNGGPVAIIAGPDRALWVANGSHIDRVTTSGKFTEFNNSPESVESVTTGPDGALWFTEASGVLRLTIQAFAALSSAETADLNPAGSIYDPDTVTTTLKKETASGAFAEYPLPTAGGGASSIIRGPDRALWFAERSHEPNAPAKIGRVTTSGTFTEYPIPTTFLPDPNPKNYPIAVNPFPISIAAGADGALWFTEQTQPGVKIGRVTTSGVLTEYSIPTASGNPTDITAGPDGALWFTEPEKIGRLAPQ